MLVTIDGKKQEIDECDCLICGNGIQENENLNYDDSYGSKIQYFHQTCFERL